MPLIQPVYAWKSWRERIRHFTWVWHAVIMSTGAISALVYNFPYHNDSPVLRIVALAIFLLNLVLFVFVCACTILRYVLFPEICGLMIAHPTQSLFMAYLPMGITTLIDSALNVNQDWGFGGTRFLWTLWGFWWLDSVFSYVVAFGMIYVMMTRQDHSVNTMTATWLMPVVTLVVASSTGGLLSHALLPHSMTLALLTTAFSFTMVIIGLSFALMMVIIGLSFALMMTTIYLLRLITNGPPDPDLVLSAFITLGPLGQGGFSLLVNGQNLSEILPLHMDGDAFPAIALAGQMVFAACFLGAYVLFSMGIAWIIVAFITIFSVRAEVELPFSMAYWGLIFPNGVFALCCLQLAKVLDSPVFRAIGAAWSCAVILLWLTVFVRTIPSVIDGSIFNAPCIPGEYSVPENLPFDQEKDLGSELGSSSTVVL